MKKGRGLKIGVVGIGSMGRHHARVSSLLSGAHLFAVADIDDKKAKEVADRYGVRVFKNYLEMLPLVDAVTISSPTETHFEIAHHCLNAGKNTLVEKPLAKNSSDAKKLVDLAQAKDLVLAVGMIERFNPAFQELTKLIKNQRVLGIHIQRFSPFPERITDANVIQDMMIHDLDLLLSLLPLDEVESMKVTGTKEKTDKLDKVSATFYLKSGTIAKIEADRVFSIKTRKITVTADFGLVETDLLNKRIYIRDLQHHIPSLHHTQDKDQLTEELKDFIKAIKTGSKPRADGNAAFRALKLAEEVEKACS